MASRYYNLPIGVQNETTEVSVVFFHLRLHLLSPFFFLFSFLPTFVALLVALPKVVDSPRIVLGIHVKAEIG